MHLRFKLIIMEYRNIQLSMGYDPMSVRSTIMLAIEKIANEHNRTLAPLTDELALLDTGLDSLALAVLVVRLEDQLNVDPFNTSESSAFPVTLGAFLAAYERATKTGAGNSSN